MYTSKRVVFEDAGHSKFQAGINKIANALRPTLGPIARIVALEQSFRDKIPEMLDDGGTIARRIIEIPDRDEDMGAMYIRGMIWKLYEMVGDGTATAAVIFQSVYNQSLKYLAAGGNAMMLQKQLKEGLNLILSELDKQTNEVDGKEDITRIAQLATGDEEIAKLIGEVVDIVGEYSDVRVMKGNSRASQREYIEGSYWDGGIKLKMLLEENPKLRVEMENTAILISDLTIEEPDILVDILTSSFQAGFNNMLIMASKFSDKTLGFLYRNNVPGERNIIPVIAPGGKSTTRAGILDDMGILTGGKPFLKASGDKIEEGTLEDLGEARFVWADRTFFGLVGGKGDPHAVRERIHILQSVFARETDGDELKDLRTRLNGLINGSAIIHVGGVTENEIKHRQAYTQKAVEVVRHAIREGSIPGGGAALLACQQALQEESNQTDNEEKRIAYRILARAMEEPARTIWHNAGFDSSETMAKLQRQMQPGIGFDVMTGEITNMVEKGLMDSAGVIKNSVRLAVSSAALALTVDVLIHHKKPDTATKP